MTTDTFAASTDRVADADTDIAPDVTPADRDSDEREKTDDDNGQPLNVLDEEDVEFDDEDDEDEEEEEEDTE